MSKVAVILSGCGVQDGSEIHEAVLTLLALAREGIAYECLAPDKQAHAVNHVTGLETGQQRNVLEESARIARGKVKDIAQAAAEDYNAVILPGGFGATKNLCTYATKQAQCEIDAGVKKFLLAMHRAGKPIGAICIAPVILAKVFGTNGSPKLTIGTDPQTANHIEAMGAEHYSCPVDDVCVDLENRMVSTPAYMLAKSVAEAARGIDKLVGEVMRLVEMPKRQMTGSKAFL